LFRDGTDAFGITWDENLGGMVPTALVIFMGSATSHWPTTNTLNGVNMEAFNTASERQIYESTATLCKHTRSGVFGVFRNGVCFDGTREGGHVMRRDIRTIGQSSTPRKENTTCVYIRRKRHNQKKRRHQPGFGGGFSGGSFHMR